VRHHLCSNCKPLTLSTVTPILLFLLNNLSYSSILSLLFINVSAVPIPLLCKCNFQRSPSLRINYLHNARSFSVFQNEITVLFTYLPLSLSRSLSSRSMLSVHCHFIFVLWEILVQWHDLSNTNIYFADVQLSPVPLTVCSDFAIHCFRGKKTKQKTALAHSL